MKVFAWPPVGVVGAEWTELAPVETSRSLVTGAEYLSAAQRVRRVASLEVSALACGEMGAGFMEMLKRHLAGVHLVRLNSYPINWRVPASLAAATRQSNQILWTAAAADLDWTAGGAPLGWFTGAILTGTTGTADGWPIVTVSGLPPLTVVARPGEFVTAFADIDDLTGTTVQVTAPAKSNASGVAAIRLFEALPAGTDVRVNVGGSDTAVFRPIGYPRAMQPVSGDWIYAWQFREVFEDEVDEFVEVNPWD